MHRPLAYQHKCIRLHARVKTQTRGCRADMRRREDLYLYLFHTLSGSKGQSALAFTHAAHWHTFRKFTFAAAAAAPVRLNLSAFSAKVLFLVPLCTDWVWVARAWFLMASRILSALRGRAAPLNVHRVYYKNTLRMRLTLKCLACCWREHLALPSHPAFTRLMLIKLSKNLQVKTLCSYCSYTTVVK